MEISIVKGTRADIDQLGLLYDDLNDYLHSHTNYPGWRKGVYPTTETAKEAVEEGTLYAAKTEGRIAGTIILRSRPEPAYAQVDWGIDLNYSHIYVVHTFAVHPHYRKKGVGKQLMDFALELGIKNSIKAIRLDVYEKNKPAIDFYKKAGFQYVDAVDMGYSCFGLDNFLLYQKIL